MNALIVDDHAVVRRGLTEILAEEFPRTIFGEARDSAGALELARTGDAWDIVILDDSLPGRSGLDVLVELREISPTLPILVYGMHPEHPHAVQALKVGASGYLSKSDLPEELIKAVRKILAGGRYISPALAERLAFDVAEGALGSNRPPHEMLSTREFQVMSMIAAGKTPSEIAEELSLSVKTISTYRARLLEKMNFRTNADIIYYVIQNKLDQE